MNSTNIYLPTSTSADDSSPRHIYSIAQQQDQSLSLASSSSYCTELRTRRGGPTCSLHYV